MKFKSDDFPLQDSTLLQQIIMLRERGMSIRAFPQELKISGNRVHSLLKKIRNVSIIAQQKTTRYIGVEYLITLACGNIFSKAANLDIIK